MARTVIGVRVALREPTPGDEAECLSLNRRSRHHYRGRVAPPYTKKQYRTWLERASRPDHLLWLVVRRSDRAIVGSVELSQIVRGRFRSAYLGYQIGAPFVRQGLMREALALAVTDAFRRLRLHRLEANVQPDNRASIGLVRALGFRHEGYSPAYLKIGGRWRDHERWAVLAPNWSRRQDRATRAPRRSPLPDHCVQDQPLSERSTTPRAFGSVPSA